MEGVQAPSIQIHKKRKAESQENERLSKRLSLLNLERNGQKLYVPEQPSSSVSPPPTKPKTPPPPRTGTGGDVSQEQDDFMQLDDTKHKVYIYDLDAELSSDSEASDDGRLVFLPDIEKHLRESRIPPVVLANSDGQLAGMDKQMVLYNVPSSLTVPKEQDSVRKAIIESRARSRARLEAKRRGESRPEVRDMERRGNFGIPDWLRGHIQGFPSASSSETVIADPLISSTKQPVVEDDPDAMDLG